jgi:DNA-binding NtrC family response regulator
MQKSILIIDDEPNARAGLVRIIQNLGCLAREAGDGASGLDLFRAHGADLVITDLRMPGMSGLSVLETLRRDAPDVPVIVITAYGSADTAREALQQGAYDFISKPFDLETIELVVRRALKLVTLEHENEALKDQLQTVQQVQTIIGESPVMQRVFSIVQHVAPTKSNVLLEGESGTGKELIAHAIHDLSARHDKPFVPVHCASFSENLLESELFGHEKGAFTGAASLRRGRFELANGGTLFLDEVSTLPLATQVKLLRVLQERCFERVGGTQTIDVDVRLVSATNAALDQLIKAGSFREDLYYRLNVVNIKIPPLRARTDDVARLIDHFLDKVNHETGKRVTISHAARQLLESYRWPGNVRELQNTIEALVVLCDGHDVTPRALPAQIVGGATPAAPGPAPDDLPDFDQVNLADVERWLILRTLQRVKTRADVARQLGISRRNLYRRLKDYGVLS